MLLAVGTVEMETLPRVLVVQHGPDYMLEQHTALGCRRAAVAE